MIFKTRYIKKQILKEYAKEVFNEVVVELNERKIGLDKRETDIKKQRLELDRVRAFGSISVVKLKEKYDEMEGQYHSLLRQSKSATDEHNESALQLKHTLDFLKGLL